MAEETPSLLLSMRDLIKEEIQSSIKSFQVHTDLPSTSSTNLYHPGSSLEEEGVLLGDNFGSDSSSSDEGGYGLPIFRYTDTLHSYLRQLEPLWTWKTPKDEKLGLYLFSFQGPTKVARLVGIPSLDGLDKLSSSLIIPLECRFQKD